jgi:hypothetical protein
MRLVSPPGNDGEDAFAGVTIAERGILGAIAGSPGAAVNEKENGEVLFSFGSVNVELVFVRLVFGSVHVNDVGAKLNVRFQLHGREHGGVEEIEGFEVNGIAVNPRAFFVIDSEPGFDAIGSGCFGFEDGAIGGPFLHERAILEEFYFCGDRRLRDEACGPDDFDRVAHIEDAEIILGDEAEAGWIA